MTETQNEARYIVGIDLGTTHSVLAYTDGHAGSTDNDGESEVRLFQIPQVVSVGEVRAQSLLPSFLFLPGPHDVPEGGLALSWNSNQDWAVGEFARSRGADLPDRLVASAKSWLCHRGVDRSAAILPWDAPPDGRRLSPLEATTRYLDHLRHGWNHEMAADDPDARLENQLVYLTVPASFDAVARELTVQAAQAAGLTQFRLLEEPQAAFYAWLKAHDEGWRSMVQVGESILVCDVGGGTCDFSLIQVTEEEGALELQRVAVGDHILLGGDNMDLTLAYAVRAKVMQQGAKLDAWQFRSLWHSCRVAKERLLGDPDLETVPVAILGRGSALIGATIRTELTRSEMETILLDGFFPICEATDYPVSKPQVGMREMGLPYAADPAITHHLAHFLGRQVGGDSATGIPFPSAVLFNGGVMKPATLRDRLLQVLRTWSGTDAIRDLQSVDLDLAVAMGAAYYGLVRQGRGVRIRAGTARSYYIGIESAMPAVPGIPTPMKALCVVPFGMEEGTEQDLVAKEFGLVVGEPVLFHFLASSSRQQDMAGEEVEDWTGEVLPVTTLETVLPATETETGGTIVPVWLRSRVTEVGTLELWCVARDDDREWKLEFSIREQVD